MASFLGLSDELLLKIFSQVDASDLVALRKVCPRLDILCCDHTLWNEADLSHQRLTCSSLSRLLTPVLAPVQMLSLRGLRNTTGLHSKQKLLTPHTIHLLAQHAPRLRHLIIRETIICARSINLECLSVLKNLQALSIINCEFINKPNTMDDGSWFSKLDKWLPKLEVLQITGTSFVEDYDIISIGKCYKLRKLILTNCTRVGIAMPYLAIAFRFGMHNLEHLDLRGTSLQNSDVLSIIYSGHIKELLLGPMGRVKRLLATPENMHNLIMADPRREEPPHQQVLVVNMGPDGPNWRQVQDDELDGLGLKWVREQNEVRRRLREQQEDKHFFIGENGHLLHPQRIDPGEGSSMSAAGGKKRKARHDVDGSRPPKKRKINAECEDEDKDDKEDSIDEYLCSSSDEDEDEVPTCDKKVSNSTLNLGCCHDIDNDFVPDECLSDLFIGNIVSKGLSLTNLHLAGCAISNHGLDLLLTHLPALESVNVMYSLVTQKYVEEVRKSHTHCKISDVRPSARRTDACTVFCAC